jgi:hypothetical protein
MEVSSTCAFLNVNSIPKHLKFATSVNPWIETLKNPQTVKAGIEVALSFVAIISPVIV